MEARSVVKPKNPKSYNKIAEKIYTLHRGMVDHQLKYPKFTKIHKTQLYSLYPKNIPQAYEPLMHLICRYTATRGKMIRLIDPEKPYPVKSLSIIGGYKDVLLAGYYCQMVFEYITIASERRSLILKRRAKQERVRVNRGTLDEKKRRYTKHTNRVATEWTKKLTKSTEDIFRELLKDTEDIYPEAFLIIKNKLGILRNEIIKKQIWRKPTH